MKKEAQHAPPAVAELATEPAVDTTETSGGLVDLGVRSSTNIAGTTVYTITDDTGEALLTNATLETVRAWTSADPLQVVLMRIAAITANLTSTLVDVKDLREQLDALTTDVLDLAAAKHRSGD